MCRYLCQHLKLSSFFYLSNLNPFVRPVCVSSGKAKTTDAMWESGLPRVGKCISAIRVVKIWFAVQVGRKQISSLRKTCRLSGVFIKCNGQKAIVKTCVGRGKFGAVEACTQAARKRLACDRIRKSDRCELVMCVRAYRFFGSVFFVFGFFFFFFFLLSPHP
jgi:hypothetical protein